MQLDLFYKLVESYKNSPKEFQATSYWQSYEQAIFKKLKTMKLEDLRSGRYAVLKTFGFNEVVFSGSLRKIALKRTLLKALTKLVGNPYPYEITLQDIRRMAYRHCELCSESSGSKPISSIQADPFGSPDDFFRINGRWYSIWFLNYYIRYCFVNKHVDFRGDEIVVELGTGSGHQVEVLKKLYPDLTILCFDLPAQIFLAENYLSKVIGNKIVSIEECLSWNSLERIKKGHVHFFGNWQFPLLSNFRFDLFWNAASFGEMEPAIVRNYLSIIGRNFSFAYLMQARFGKQTAGLHHVKTPVTFEDYDNYLAGCELLEVSDSFLAHRPLSGSGGYFNAIWRQKNN